MKLSQDDQPINRGGQRTVRLQRAYSKRLTQIQKMLKFIPPDALDTWHKIKKNQTELHEFLMILTHFMDAIVERNFAKRDISKSLLHSEEWECSKSLKTLEQLEIVEKF
jgi:hypothetical protein